MFTHYQQERTALVDGLLAMASHTETALANATRAYVERDDMAAWLVEENDDVLDHYEIEMDKVAIGLLAMAPLGAELRLVAVAMRISRDLERIGDQAVEISRRTLALNAEPRLERTIDIPGTAMIAREMLRASVTALIDRNPDVAYAVIARGVEAARLNHRLQRELSSFIVEKPTNIPRCLDLLEIARSIERIVEHVTTIAEQVVYLCGAREIRNSGNRAHEFERTRC